MKHKILAFSLAFFALACGGKDPVDPTPAAPDSITLSSASFDVAQAGETVSLEITAPVYPRAEGAPEWITVKGGTYKNYKMMMNFVVEANEDYASRSAELTITAGSAAPRTVTVNQRGKDFTPATPPAAPQDGDSRKIASWLGLGWNMGNHFDGFYNSSSAGEKEGYPDETVWHQQGKATQATFVGVKAAGFTSVRIPVSWLRMIGPAPDYKIDETWMNRVYEVVQMASKAGLTVIVNTHHDENHGSDNTYQWLDIKHAVDDPALNARIKDEIRAVWTQIANRFKDCGDWLILEGFNEINDGQWGWSDDFRKDPTRQCDILNEWNQVFVSAVRATGGNNAVRWLGVPTYAANPEYEKYLTLPDDPAGRTMLAVHFYDPSDYTIGDKQWSDWGHTGQAGKKATYGDEDHVRAVFGNLYTRYVEKGVPVYLGEFGCSRRNPSDSRAWGFYLYYLEYVVKAAKTYGLPCYLWDNAATGYGKERHGYIHHGTGAYVDGSRAIVDVMVKAMFTEDPAYTLQSIYDHAPKF